MTAILTRQQFIKTYQGKTIDLETLKKQQEALDEAGIDIDPEMLEKFNSGDLKKLTAAELWDAVTDDEFGTGKEGKPEVVFENNKGKRTDVGEQIGVLGLLLGNNEQKKFDFDAYKRGARDDVFMASCVPMKEFAKPPQYYSLVEAKDKNSFAYYLQNHPICATELLEYDKSTQKKMMEYMPTKKDVDRIMSKFTLSNIKAAEKKGIRLSAQKDSYLGNNFSNAECLAMAMGWEDDVDPRKHNFYKSRNTEGRLNISTLPNQDCIDSVLRLNIEHKLSQKDYAGLEKTLGIRISPNMNNAQIDKKISRWMRGTSTRSWSENHHELGDLMKDKQASKMNFEIGDTIVFNDPGKRGGHAAMIVNKAVNADGKAVYQIATGTLPATDLALYEGSGKGGGTWYPASDLLGGGKLAEILRNSPGGFSRFLGYFVDPAIKGEKYSVSAGSIDPDRGKNIDVPKNIARKRDDISHK